ncbi:MAG: hypothetical protein JST54_02490 [Deltaproteobacteria bacterium]|nr:hypothetical protein [Deltaproteobacteria bacterium]
MNCEHCQEKLLDYELEALDAADRAEVAQHLLSCATCKAELERLQAGRASLAHWPDVEPARDLADNTLSALDAEWGGSVPRRARMPEREKSEPRFPPREALAVRAPRKLFRPMLTPLAACALLACVGYYAHISNLQVRLGAEVFGAGELSPESMSLVRLALFDVSDHTPLPNRKVKVSLKDPNGNISDPLFVGESDAQGQVAAKLNVPRLAEGKYQLVVQALDGDDSTSVLSPVTLKRSFRIQLSTDKPMYQPGQTIHARALAFDSGSQKPAHDASLTFSVYDPKGSRIFKKAVAVDTFGVASFDLPLADELNLGGYKVAAELGDTRSESDVQVARYSLPKFELKVELDQPWNRPGQPATGHVRAKYFFGKPVAHAKVNLEAGVFVDRFIPVAHQDLELDGDGLASFKLDLPPSLPGSALAEGNAVLQISAVAHDTANEEVEKHAELIVAERALAVTAVAENGTLTPGVPNRLLILVAHPDGQPVAKAQVTLDGSGDTATTGDDGVGQLMFVPRPGRRDVSVTAVAPDGSRVSRTLELADRPSFALLHTEKSLYTAGETVKGSALGTSALRVAYLDVIVEGRTVLTQTVDLRTGKGDFAFDLPAEISGAVSLELYERDQGELLRTRRIVYVSNPRGLKVDVAVERASYKPGETAKLRFHVADEKGNPQAAGLGLSVVDESVFALASKDPAMLRAFLTLSEELRKPRFNLDPASVFTSMNQQQAANLLFSASEQPPVVRELGETDGHELAVRRAGLAAFKDKRTGTAWFAGLFMLGLMLEGVLRMFAEKLLVTMVRHKFGWLLLGSGVVFVLTDLMSDTMDHSTGALMGLGTLIVGGGFLYANAGGEFRFGRLVGYFGGLFICFCVVVTLFGDNIRRMFGASVDSIAGTADMRTGAGKAPYSHGHRNVTNFAAYATDDGPVGAAATPPAQNFADNLAQHEEMLAKPVEQLRQRRQQTIQVIKGTGEGGNGIGALATANTPVDGTPEETPAPLTEEAKSTVRVRSYFPETLFWAPEVVTDEKGDATVEVPGADSITTWRAAVTASSADGRIGTGQAALQVFQDFFVDIDMPPVLTVGDEVEIPLAVHNYLDHPETVTLEIEQADWLSSSAPRDYKLSLKPGEVAGISYRFTATKFGPQQGLTVYAIGPHGKDAVRREVEVRPAGVAFDQVQNGIAEHGAFARLALPPDAVAGASRAELRLYPSTFSAVMDGLENVLRMPSGCFEQTSSTTYPNALVVRYLRDNKKGTPELLARGETYLTTGYQRLLSFEVQGGGFEWFGRAPANQVLTAYGLLEFHDMAQVFDVDEAVISRTQEWLVSRQGYDGSWDVDHQSLSDGLYRDSFRGRLTTTAYVTWALAESGYRGTATDRASRYLQAHLDEAEDTYTLALIANALADLAPNQADRAVERLVTRQVQGEKGALYFPAGAGTVTYARGGDADVETTALAASALMQTHRADTAMKALRWLLGTRDPHGTWNSTQATVLALRALLQAAGQSGLSEAHGTLKIATGHGTRSVTFTPDQADVVQRVDLTDLLASGPLELRFDGDASAAYQLEVSGYRPREAPPKPALALDLDYDHAELKVDDTIQAKLTATYQLPGASGMVLIQAAIPPGFEAVPADLEKLVAMGKLAKFANDGKQLTFYVDRLQTGRALTLSYGLRAKFPVRAVAPASSAYLYYQPAVHAESKPTAVNVAAR